MKPQIRFKEFTDDWEEKKLGEVSEITSSKRVFQQEWTNEGIPFYRARDLVSLQKNQILPDPLYISLETYLNKIKVSGEINKDDILVTGVGSLGVPYLVKSNDKFYFKDGNILWIKNIVSDSFYTYYYFLTSKVQRHIKMEAAGSTVGTFTIQTAKQLKFKFPSIPEQEKIGKFFSLLDQRIEKQERKVALLEERKKGWMQKLFNQEIRFKGNYPDWEEKKLGEISISKGGTALEKYVNDDGKYYFISIGNYGINGRYIDNGQRIDLTDKTKERLLEKNDLVMILNDKTSSGEILGTCILIPENNKYIYNQRSQRIVLNNDIFPLYAYYYLNYPFRKKVVRQAQGGTQIYVNYSSVENMFLKIPSLPEQEKIANFLSAQDELIEKEKEKLNLMKEEKKGFMQRMFV